MAENTVKIKTHKRLPKDQRIVSIVGYVVIGIIALVCLAPFYLIIIASFTSEASLIKDGYPLVPTSFDFQSYALCLKNPTAILRSYGVTIGVTAMGTFLSVFLATMTGYFALQYLTNRIMAFKYVWKVS